MESGRAVPGVDHDPEAESAGLYREWLPQCDLRERMVFRDFFSTMYFWIVTVVLFGLGAVIFKRLKVHFADVL